MYYWRKENFEGLKQVIEYLADNTKLQSYRNYCLNREKGLRKQAFTELERFIKETSGWSFEEKRDFVDWLLWILYGNPEIYDLVPKPLYKHLINPTLALWKKIEPTNSAAYRWSEDLEDLQRSVQLNEKDQIAICRFAKMVIRCVDYSIHEIPSGYLGNPVEDIKLVTQALQSLSIGIQTEDVKSFTATLTEYYEVISNWTSSNPRHDEL